ncbi:hypothetical protein GDO81_011113 [Engystomops pustulosus]|uniref:Transmembrane protein 65 n=1 Tax=Engystomops pustulosus TaxID=76066 RepID=A0AAV7BCG5_ENGPU|nr:hypothetical protein GDO81_011113 [Engystomops pustulosus]
MLSRTVVRPMVSPKPWRWLGMSSRKHPGSHVLQSCRLLGTHPRKEPIESLNTAQGARDFIYSLHATERSCLLRELHRFESIAIAQVFVHNALPFVGFGFLDNAIMIAAGTQIEFHIGALLGISTMAAAALGNLVSDLAGLGLAGYVEAISSRLGLPIPDLTPKQADMWQTRVSAHMHLPFRHYIPPPCHDVFPSSAPETMLPPP